MVDGEEGVADDIQDLGVGLDVHVGAGEKLGSNQNRRHGLEQLSYSLVARHRNGLVRRVRQPVGVDDGRVHHIAGLDVNAAS